jgi:hypothetical protein
LFLILPALGLRLSLAVDHDALRQYAGRELERRAQQARPGNLAQVCGRRTLERALRHLAVLPWNEVLATVAEMRAKVAAEQAAKAGKEEAESAAKETTATSKVKPLPAQPASTAAYDRGVVSALKHVANHAAATHFRGQYPLHPPDAGRRSRQPAVMESDVESRAANQKLLIQYSRGYISLNHWRESLLESLNKSQRRLPWIYHPFKVSHSTISSTTPPHLAWNSLYTGLFV